MNLPNSLTLLRIFFVPLLIVVLLTRSPNVDMWGFPMHFEFWGVLILLVAAATDWADGYFARRRLQVTTLGILLDPIADKLLISGFRIACGHATSAGVDGGDHYRAGIYGSGLAQHRFG
jgi:CDP-diacylglycerol--glycerol-3-phosphate 3-phosphatidyltransferase